MAKAEASGAGAFAAQGESLRVLTALYKRIERLLRKCERRGDLKNAATFAAQLYNLSERITLAEHQPRKGGPVSGRQGSCCPRCGAALTCQACGHDLRTSETLLIRVVREKVESKRTIEKTPAQEDVELVVGLERLCARTDDERIAAAALRLASLIMGRPLGASLERKVSDLEASDV